jgi:hypothetical protein
MALLGLPQLSSGNLYNWIFMMQPAQDRLENGAACADHSAFNVVELLDLIKLNEHGRICWR